jgi:hypothetical protein
MDRTAVLGKAVELKFKAKEFCGTIHNVVVQLSIERHQEDR